MKVVRSYFSVGVVWNARGEGPGNALYQWVFSGNSEYMHVCVDIYTWNISSEAECYKGYAK